jgi:hypothetical protein
MASAPLTAVPVDQERFAELEQIIEHGLGTFVDVGRALYEIQQRRLYRAVGYTTFADYVARRWDISSAHAYRQIDASKVIDILSPTGEMPLPANEAQARELAPFVNDPEAVRAIWRETVEDGGGRITAKSIRQHISVRRPGGHARREPSARAAHAITCPACGHEWQGTKL